MKKIYWVGITGKGKNIRKGYIYNCKYGASFDDCEEARQHAIGIRKYLKHKKETGFTIVLLEQAIDDWKELNECEI